MIDTKAAKMKPREQNNRWNFVAEVGIIYKKNIFGAGHVLTTVLTGWVSCVQSTLSYQMPQVQIPAKYSFFRVPEPSNAKTYFEL